MAYILHIDTSADTGTVALAKDGNILTIRENSESRNHAASINLMINEVVAANKISLKDLSAISVCGGPGSYTGLRIGLSTAKGLCYALDKPLLLPDRLNLLAVSHFSDKVYDNYMSILTAREGEYFIAVYNSSNEVTIEPQHVYEDDLQGIIAGIQGKTLCISDNMEAISSFQTADFTIKNDIKINNQAWAVYSYNVFNRNGFVNLASAEPFYLKQVYTHKPKKTN